MASNKFNNRMFRFFIGPEKQEFTVHHDVIAETSPVLNRMMNGEMVESMNGMAELPECEPATFGRFLTYTYCHNQRLAGTDENVNEGLERNIAPRSRIILLMLAMYEKEFGCKSCGSSCQLRFSTSFPYCQVCTGDEDRGWRTTCLKVRCSTTGERLEGLLCYDHKRRLDQIAKQFPEIAKPHLRSPLSLSKFESSRFEIPLRAIDSFDLAPELFYGLDLSQTTILDIGKLAILGDTYNMPKIFETSLRALDYKFATLSHNETALSNVVEFAQLVYNNTPASEDETCYEDKHILRRMVSDYVATHLEQFVVPPYLTLLSKTSDGFTSDILLAITRMRKL